jgi:hypothetical protein
MLRDKIKVKQDLEAVSETHRNTWNSPAIVAFAVLLPRETPIISTELMALVLDFESGRVGDS